MLKLVSLVIMLIHNVFTISSNWDSFQFNKLLKTCSKIIGSKNRKDCLLLHTHTCTHRPIPLSIFLFFILYVGSTLGPSLTPHGPWLSSPVFTPTGPQHHCRTRKPCIFCPVLHRGKIRGLQTSPPCLWLLSSSTQPQTSEQRTWWGVLISLNLNSNLTPAQQI